MNNILNFILIISVVVIAVCQIKQAWFPVLYPSYDSEEAGVEIAETDSIDEGNPLYKAIIEAYESSKAAIQPSEFIQYEIDPNAGVEIITDRDELLYEGL
jgi:hypothetical protein